MSTMSLKLPVNYVDVENEEMEYLDGGGWNSYRGWDAVRELTAIIGNTFAWGGVTTALVGKALVEAATGVGVILAIASALGASVGMGITTLQGTLATIAAGYYLRDGGFQANSVCVWKFTVYYGVRAL